MYAVIETGGKQYCVKTGDIIQVEKLKGDVGSSVQLDQVLLVSKPGTDQPQVWLGKPLLSGATVQAEVVGQGRGEKILIVKMKRRKQYRRTQGHRQDYTQLIITALNNGAGESHQLDAAAKKTAIHKFQSHLKPRLQAEAAPKKSAAKTSQLRGASAEAAAPQAKTKKTPAKKKAKES